MNFLLATIQKVNIWNKILKGLIPILLCITALATLPEHNNGGAFYIEKNIEKEEKERNTTEESDTEEEVSYESVLKKAKFKKKTPKIYPLDIALSALNFTFTLFPKPLYIIENIPQVYSCKPCPFYILCHQLVFYEG